MQQKMSSQVVNQTFGSTWQHGISVICMFTTQQLCLEYLENILGLPTLRYVYFDILK